MLSCRGSPLATARQTYSRQIYSFNADFGVSVRF
jgi:hypothetical protein